jgi:hypothetical protein
MSEKPDCVPENVKDINRYVSRYSDKVNKIIKKECIYLFTVLFISLLILFLNWKGIITNLIDINQNKEIVCKKYIYFGASGLLGGITFGIKVFYRSVARGEWEADRKYWRIMSPHVAMVIAIVVGTMIDAGLMSTSKGNAHAASSVAVGFFSGYFADEAVGKMYDVASVIFGNRLLEKDKPKERNNDLPA